ncbi:MAG: glutamate--cysteine ligase [Deltaproteobacteria bacterium]|nr:glutamate--cysteine ligase [Deltaproteobacteria bacterium]
MDRPPLTPDDLEAYHHASGRAPDAWRTGMEVERFALGPEGRPLPWRGGIRDLLERFASRSGWTLLHEAGEPVALAGPGGTRLSLEPGGQVELSGAPHARLVDVSAEDVAVRDLLSEAAGPEVKWAACGYLPLARPALAPWVPRSRYRVLRAFLRGRGPFAWDMMRGTCAVQIHLDHGDEADCGRKVALAVGLAPVLLALTANSPLREGRPTGLRSWRAAVWRGTDSDRTGFPPPLLGPWSHRAWVEWLLDVPMVFLRDKERHVPAGGIPFRRFLAEGLGGRAATLDDWILHETAVFTEVRVKQTIEIRCADSVASGLACAVAALCTGLAYDTSALDASLALLADLRTRAPVPDLLAAAARDGLEAEAGRPFGAWAEDLVTLARRSLRVRQPEAEILLDPAEARARERRCPADDLLDAWRRDPRAVLEAVDR